MQCLTIPVISRIEKTNININDLDFDTVSKLLFPIGSFYYTTSPSIDPNIFLSGKWELLSDADDCFLQGSNICGKDKTLTENVIRKSDDIYSSPTALSTSQVYSHWHNIGIKLKLKTQSSGGIWRTYRTTKIVSPDVYEEKVILPAGEGASHTHKIKSHYHNYDSSLNGGVINPPSVKICVWVRKE